VQRVCARRLAMAAPHVAAGLLPFLAGGGQDTTLGRPSRHMGPDAGLLPLLRFPLLRRPPFRRQYPGGVASHWAAAEDCSRDTGGFRDRLR